MRKKKTDLSGFTGIGNDYVRQLEKVIDLIPGIKDYVPFDMPTLIEAYRKDRHFNTDATSLDKWDAVMGLSISVRGIRFLTSSADSGFINLLYKNGIELVSMYECISMLKTAAMLMVLQELVKNAYGMGKIDICMDLLEEKTTVFGILDEHPSYFDFKNGLEKKKPEKLEQDMEHTSWEMAKVLRAHDIIPQLVDMDPVGFLLSCYPPQ